MQPERGQIAQGDILLIPIDAIPEGLPRVPARDGRLILASGERTGHHHTVAERDAELYGGVAEDIDRFLRVRSAADTPLTHEEHRPAPVTGDYVVRRQYQYSPEAVRRAAD